MSHPAELPFAFAVNQYTTLPWSFEQDVRRYAESGVEAMELCQDKLDSDSARATAQLEGDVEAGLTICSVQPSVRTVVPSVSQPHPTDPRERLAAFRSCVEQIAPYAPGAVFVTNTGLAPEGNVAEAIRRTVRAHRELADVAAAHGVRIALEPLNPVSLNQETAIWTVQQALSIVEEVGEEEVGLCFDTWNVWQNPDLLDAMAQARERIFLLQVSDWRTPRSGADRRTVGTGLIPTGRLLHALYENGYRGPCVLEIFSQGVPDSLYDTDLDELLRVNRAALGRAWRADCPGWRGPMAEAD